MWLMLNDCFLSIVSKDCARDELLVRARRLGDIEKIFPGAKVERSTKTDYLFRAKVKRGEVEAAMVGEVRRINYGNFKDSVPDKPLHDAYLRCWHAMAALQPSKPYSGLRPGTGSLWDLPEVRDDAGNVVTSRGKKRRKRRSIKRGR